MLFFRKSVAAAVLFPGTGAHRYVVGGGLKPPPSLSGVLVYCNLVDAIVRPSTSTP
jgi:hypothetical protein